MRANVLPKKSTQSRGMLKIAGQLESALSVRSRTMLSHVTHRHIYVCVVYLRIYRVVFGGVIDRPMYSWQIDPTWWWLLCVGWFMRKLHLVRRIILSTYRHFVGELSARSVDEFGIR